MGAGALAHGVAVVAEESVFVGIDHGAGGIVHGAGQHAQIGCRHVVARKVVHRSLLCAGLPLAVLQTLYPFKVHDVGIGALYAERLQSVQVEQQVVLGGAGGQLIGGANHALVVAVEEVNLESFHAHGLIVCHGPFHVAYAVAPAAPQYHTHPFLPSVVHKLLQVYFWVQVFEQAFLAAPSFVDDDIFQMVACGEVDVVAVGGGVHAGHEVHPRQVGVVPPVPGHLARLYPRGVLEAAGRRQPLCHVAVQQVGVVGAHQHGAPGQFVGRLALMARYVVGAARGHQVQPPISAYLFLQGVGCEIGLQAVSLSLEQHHARIVFHAGVHHHRFLAVGQAHCQRGDGQ